MSELVVMLAAGGTGGHLFPAFALAEELGRRGIVVDLVTDERGDRYGSGFPARTVHEVPAATLSGRNPIAVGRTVATLGRGVKRAYALLGRVKPAAVVGFGGYPTFPPLIAAKLRGIPTGLHEQNAVMGRANRMLVSRVDRIGCSFENTKFVPEAATTKVRVTGNPVRDVVLRAARIPYETPNGGEPVVIVVFGGSQGARFFSDAVPPALAALPVAIKSRLIVVQQAREEDLDRVRAAYQAAGIRAELASFFKTLPELIANSHLVIGRAGASTVAELSVLGRPSLLVPLPHALDNDQLNNAKRLADAGGALCIEQKDLTGDRLTREIAGLVGSPERLAAAAAAAKGQGKPDAVARLADLVDELVRLPRRSSKRTSS